MQKQQVKAVITTVGNYVVTADDATLPMQGTGAYGAITTGKDVTVKDGDSIKYVPYAAIDHAEITLTMTTVAGPTDDTCPAPTP